MKRTDIDALARLLDGDMAHEATGSGDARALAALAVALESSAAPLDTRAFASTAGAPHATATLPRPEFRAELRATLIEAARAQTANPPVMTRLRNAVDDATTRWRYSTRVAAATGATALALSSGGVAVAAQHALPNEALYGIRLTLEDARLLLISDPFARAEQRLAYASERIDDAEAVAHLGDFAAAARALDEADESARTAAGELIAVARDRQDPRALDTLETWTDEQRDRLDDLAPLLGGEASVSLDSVIVALSRISSRLTVLETCSTCASIAGMDLIPAANQPFNACLCADGSGRVAAPSGGTKPSTSSETAGRTKTRSSGSDTTTADGSDGSSSTGSTSTGTSTAPDDDGGTSTGSGDGDGTPTVSLPGDDATPPTGTNTGSNEEPPDVDDDGTVAKTVDKVIKEVTDPQAPKSSINGSSVGSDLGL